MTNCIQWALKKEPKQTQASFHKVYKLGVGMSTWVLYLDVSIHLTSRQEVNGFQYKEWSRLVSVEKTHLKKQNSAIYNSLQLGFLATVALNIAPHLHLTFTLHQTILHADFYMYLSFCSRHPFLLNSVCSLIL